MSLEVYAASSLTESFRELEALFNETHPTTKVSLTFAGSHVLRMQIEQGAKANIIASASQVHIQALAHTGLIDHSQPFAQNDLALIVPLDNPSNLVTFKDLVNAKRLVIGSEHAPIGAYTRSLFQQANQQYGDSFSTNVLAQVVSIESNARLIRAKVELGEADAAIVYHTDAVASTKVRVIELPEALQQRVTYVMATIPHQGDTTRAMEWLTVVRSDQGQAIMGQHGFKDVE
jgi:molybdate transport system substrate-binding protein